MAKEKPDIFIGEWFPWYAEKALTSEEIDGLTLAEEGAYRRLIDKAWLKGSLPADPSELANVIGKKCTVKIAERLLKISHIKTMPGNRKRVIHTVVERVRAEQREKSEKKIKKARDAAEKRWATEASKNGRADATSNAQAMLNDAIRIEEIRIDKNKEEEREAARPPSPPPADLKFEDSAFDHPAVVIYQEKFQVKVRTNFAKAVADRVKDLSVWTHLIADKIAWADEPLEKRQNVAKWILKAYDERVEQKRSGVTVGGRSVGNGFVPQQPIDDREFQKMLRNQQGNEKSNG